MSAIEQEILDKLHRLDEAAKQRVLALVEQELEASPISLEDWLKQATEFRKKLRKKYGPNHFNIQSTLSEIREEASWPRW